MLGILLDALVGICAILTRIGETKGATGQEPLGHEVVDQAFAQNHFGRLIEPDLRHIKSKQYPRQNREDAKLLNEGGDISARQRIVEWLVPGVEPNLRIGRCADDSD